jgi:hypothetical protein
MITGFGRLSFTLCNTWSFFKYVVLVINLSVVRITLECLISHGAVTELEKKPIMHMHHALSRTSELS